VVVAKLLGANLPLVVSWPAALQLEVSMAVVVERTTEANLPLVVPEEVEMGQTKEASHLPQGLEARSVACVQTVAPVVVARSAGGLQEDQQVAVLLFLELVVVAAPTGEAAM